MSWIDEYHVKLIELERDRDRWQALAMCGYCSPKFEKYCSAHIHLSPKRSSLQESIDFVVDMMNSGIGNPDKIYPRNRYHGD